MKLSLVVLSEGKAKGQAIPVTLSQFLIGRDPQCHLRPASAMISKRHCAILVKNGKVFVRDFDSTNGTSVNEEPIKGERELKHADLLKVGPLAFRVHLEGMTPVNKPTPTPPPKKREANEDDDVAAMLLSLQDDSPAVVGAGSSGEIEVPDGTTMMDIPRPPESEGGDAKEPAKADAKAENKKLEEAKKANADTSAAAKAILEKYNRRSRS
jgi:pSer/pThr/pTyr-binding forkhead associated (FHA) protein